MADHNFRSKLEGHDKTIERSIAKNIRAGSPTTYYVNLSAVTGFTLFQLRVRVCGWLAIVGSAALLFASYEKNRSSCLCVQGQVQDRQSP